MKSIPLPEGMVVTSKIHLGHNHYRMKLIQGYIRSFDNEKLAVDVGRETGHQFVAVNVNLAYTIRCNNCGGWKDLLVEMIMN